MALNDRELIEIVRANCDEIGLCFDDYKKSKQNRLIDIEKYIQSKKEEFKKSIDTIVNIKSSCDAVSVAKAIGVSRATLYAGGKDTINYLNQSKSNAFVENPFDVITDQSIKIRMLKEQVNLMMERDVNTCLMRNQIISLEEKLQTAQEENRRLNERLLKIAGENQQYKTQLINYNVISIDPPSENHKPKL